MFNQIGKRHRIHSTAATASGGDWLFSGHRTRPSRILGLRKRLRSNGLQKRPPPSPTCGKKGLSAMEKMEKGNSTKPRETRTEDSNVSHEATH